jgi:hypothetical protein
MWSRESEDVDVCIATFSRAIFEFGPPLQPTKRKSAEYRKYTSNMITYTVPIISSYLNNLLERTQPLQPKHAQQCGYGGRRNVCGELTTSQISGPVPKPLGLCV